MLGHNHPAIVIPQNSEYAKEMRRHEAFPGAFGLPGRPYVFREFPKRLYKAARVAGQGIQLVDAVTVHNEQEERNLQSRGFHFGPDTAIAAIEAEQTEHGRLAAEREWQIQHGRLSEQAVQEVRQAEAEAGAVHLPDVPLRSRKARGQRVEVPA